MSARGKRPAPRVPRDQGLSLPGYGLDLAVQPCPLSLRRSDALHALAAESVSSFLEHMATSSVVGLRRH
jgi:hypothetical protein